MYDKLDALTCVSEVCVFVLGMSVHYNRAVAKSEPPPSSNPRGNVHVARYIHVEVNWHPLAGVGWLEPCDPWRVRSRRVGSLPLFYDEKLCPVPRSVRYAFHCFYT